MIKTWFGYMTAQEAKMIGDIAREEKRQKKKSSQIVVNSFNLTKNTNLKNEK